MPAKPRRRFGSIRKRASGRYQVRYQGPDGQMRSAPQTFERKSDAERYLTLMEAQLVRNEWVDPTRGQVKVAEYAERWIAQRPGLRPRTVHLYTWLLGKHVRPYLGGVPLAKLDTPMVREWRTTLLSSGVSSTMAAKAYRLLRAILTTAVKEDEILRVNPCRIPGADQERPAERPVLSVAQVLVLAEKMPSRYRALILVTTFACLRWGEVAAFQRRDIDLGAGAVKVRQAFVEQRGVGLTLGPPKSKAGMRTVSIPSAVVAALRSHLEKFVEAQPTALVFTGPNGRPILRGNFNKLVSWPAAATAIGMPGLHFHDLRHTGNTLAANTGASLRDLMARMGHDSSRAALIYQHASSEADRRIADAVGVQIDVEEAARATRRRPEHPKGAAADHLGEGMAGGR
jgi:integrase